MKFKQKVHFKNTQWGSGGNEENNTVPGHLFGLIIIIIIEKKLA